MKKVSRAELLEQLTAVAPGLSPRDIIEQSSCFVFQDGEVITFNGEIACRAKTDLKLIGAVQAKPLLSMLEKLPEDELELRTQEGELIVIGKRRSTGIRMENEVLIPVENVERAKKFKPLNDDFLDAISMAQACTGKDQNKFWTTCVHIHPKWIEACDNYQILRYKLNTGIDNKQGVLVRGTSIKHIVNLEMTAMAETDTWIHFKNKTGLVFSCCKWIEEYKTQELTSYIKFDGTRTVFPKGIAEASERANIFSEENMDSNYIKVQLRPGKLKIRGEGISGWYSETKKIAYKGKPLEFLIPPSLLVELTKRHNECEVSNERLKVNGGQWVYVTILGKPGETRNEDDEETEESKEGSEESED